VAEEFCRSVLLLADHNCPLADKPLLDQAFADVRIVGDEAPHDRVVIGSEHQRRTVGWVSVRAREDQLTPLLRFPCESEVLLTERRPTFDVVIDQFVDEQEVHNDHSACWTASSPVLSFEGNTLRVCLGRAAIGGSNDGTIQVSDASDPELPETTVGTSRLEAFSDGVMAVIITITALSLKAPLGESFSALSRRLPELLVYILSFTFVGIYWNNHHHLLRVTRHISGGVMWGNLHLLFWLSLIPVVTEWVGGFYGDHWPAAAYGIVALGAAIAFSILVLAIIQANGRDSLVGRAIGSDRKGSTSMALYACGIGLAFLSPYVGYALYALVAVIWFIPDRRFERLGYAPSEN
jgi:uncharacterized membrane protein